jgi:hypothetical protein
MLPATHKKAFAAAKAGELDEIQSLFRAKDAETRADVYMWLLVAADRGHAGAAQAAKKVLDEPALRRDLEVAGLSHLNIGEWYLTGANGFSVDLALARKHLERAKEMCDFDLVVDSFTRSRRKLAPPAAAVLDAIFPAPAKKKR